LDKKYCFIYSRVISAKNENEAREELNDRIKKHVNDIFVSGMFDVCGVEILNNILDKLDEEEEKIA
tara:strand:- start:42 stop:239 length:198 start_codon:yes stop_codon:yes gene_type:complete